MNPRILELKKLATTTRYTGCGEIDELNLEKFAELIVAECINVASKYDAPKMSGPGLVIGSMISEHFGVEP